MSSEPPFSSTEPGPEVEVVLERGRAAANRGDWEQAYELLAQTDLDSVLTVADFPLLADAAYATGHFEMTISAWERAYAQAAAAGNPVEAAGAAVRVAMHLLFDTALMAPVRGWATRAEQLLDGVGETPVHAWLAVVRNYERLLSGDFVEARFWAGRAIEVGTRLAPAAAAIGRVAEARSLILEGDVARGLDLLNEAGVATLTGELDPLSTGIVYCELVCAFQAVAQYDLAEEWTEAMENWRQGQPVGSVHGRCRVHRAEILRLRGAFADAEKEALLACEELRPYLRRELGWPLTELGRIRLRMGDVEGGKQAFLAAHNAGWDPQPGLALVLLAEGDAAQASASLRDALDHPLNVPSKEFPPHTELRRAPLLEALVEVDVQRGALPEALTAAEELVRIATRFESPALAASGALSMGRVRLAEGAVGTARAHFEEAERRWNKIGAPYEVAQARIEMGRTYQLEGRVQLAQMEFRAASTALSELGATREVARVAGLATSVGAQAEPRRDGLAGETFSTEATFRREGDYWTIALAGPPVRMRDLKGMHYLARLLSEPGREFHVLDLVALERGATRNQERPSEAGLSFTATMNSGEMLDAQAKEAYRERLSDIDKDIEDARAMGDDERAAQSVAERDFLIRELARAFGLGGRKRLAGSASERARAGVTRAVRNAISRIGDYNPPLAEHLQHSISTGTYCAYRPDPRAAPSWSL